LSVLLGAPHRHQIRAAEVCGDCAWWKYTWPLHQEFKGSTRILVPYRAKSNRFAVDDNADFLGLTDTTVLYDNDQPESLHYIAAVLNSKVSTYRFSFIGKLVGGGTYEYFHNTVGKLPVPRKQPGDRLHDGLVALSRRLHEETRTLHSTLVPEEQAEVQERIDQAVSEIDGLVCELFGLTDAEFAQIESTLVE